MTTLFTPSTSSRKVKEGKTLSEIGFFSPAALTLLNRLGLHKSFHMQDNNCSCVTFIKFQVKETIISLEERLRSLKELESSYIIEMLTCLDMSTQMRQFPNDLSVPNDSFSYPNKRNVSVAYFRRDLQTHIPDGHLQMCSVGTYAMIIIRKKE